MQELVFSFPKKSLNGDEKSIFALEVCKTLASGGSPIRYVGGTIYIPELPELGTYKIVNKSLLLTPLALYVETVQQQLAEKYTYEFTVNTVVNQLAELLSYLGGTQSGLVEKQRDEKNIDIVTKDNDIFHDETYLINDLLPKLYPHIKWSLVDHKKVKIQIIEIICKLKKSAKYNEFFLYVLQKYKKDQSTEYSSEEQVEIICIYLRQILKIDLQVVGGLPLGKYTSLRNCLTPISIHSSVTVQKKRLPNKRSTKQILKEGKENGRIFNEELICELGYSAVVYKDIQEILKIDYEKGVLEVAMDFLNMSESDFFLYCQNRKTRTIMLICKTLFQEYEIYVSTSYKRWFIK